MGKKEYTGGTESGSRTMFYPFLSRIIENQNSDFVTVLVLKYKAKWALYGDSSDEVRILIFEKFVIDVLY